MRRAFDLNVVIRPEISDRETGRGRGQEASKKSATDWDWSHEEVNCMICFNYVLVWINAAMDVVGLYFQMVVFEPAGRAVRWSGRYTGRACCVQLVGAIGAQ